MALMPLLAAVACTALSPQTDTWTSSSSKPQPPTMTTDPLWACLNHPIPLIAPDAAPPTATYVAAIVDFYSQPKLLKAIPTLTVDVCADPTCVSPITDRVTITHPGAPFVWSFEMPYMVNVFLRTKAEGYVDFNYVLGGPLIGTPNGATTIQGLVIPPITEMALDELYTQVNAGPRDTSKGILAVRTLNCYQGTDGSPDQALSRGEGVQLQVTQLSKNAPPAPPAVGWALSFNNKARPAVDNVLPLTDSRGVVGYFQLEPGNYGVKAIAPTGATLADTIWTVYPNVVTLAEARRGLEQWGQ
jgi:hypothetical protein